MNKLFVRKKEKVGGRITDANVDEHKERVLARGRKFKYPLQYSKYRVVVNTAIIGAVVLVGSGIFTWLSLYVWQNTGDVAYGITRVLPLAVSEVDGRSVRFSDYLMIYRSSVASIERQQGSLSEMDGGGAISDEYKRQAMNDVEGYVYAMKLADELGVEVTREDMDELSRVHRTIGGVEKSRETYEAILRNNFGLSVGEYERLLRLVIMRRKVEEKIDERALQRIRAVEARLHENGGDMRAAAGEDGLFEGSRGLVDRDNLDGWRAEEAMKLEVGQVSRGFVSQNGDGYYVVKTLGKSESQVEYESVFVRFTELADRLAEMRKTCGGDEPKVRRFIDVGVENEDGLCYIGR